MPEGKKNTAPIPAPVRDEDGYSAKTHLHQPVQETATVAATALLADAPEGALPSEVRPEIVTWEKLCEAIQASGKAYNMEMIQQKAYELANMPTQRRVPPQRRTLYLPPVGSRPAGAGSGHGLRASPLPCCMT